MNPIAKMSDLLTPLEMQNDDYRSFFDRQSGEIVTVERSILSAVEEGDDEGLEDEVPGGRKAKWKRRAPLLPTTRAADL